MPVRYTLLFNEIMCVCLCVHLYPLLCGINSFEVEDGEFDGEGVEGASVLVEVV